MYLYNSMIKVLEKKTDYIRRVHLRCKAVKPYTSAFSVMFYPLSFSQSFRRFLMVYLDANSTNSRCRVVFFVFKCIMHSLYSNHHGIFKRPNIYFELSKVNCVQPYKYIHNTYIVCTHFNFENESFLILTQLILSNSSNYCSKWIIISVPLETIKHENENILFWKRRT